MSVILTAELKTGRIFGDLNTNEYVYMPAGEIGVKNPLCVYETGGERRDITLWEALRLIRVRSLRAVHHPRLGDSSC